MAVIYSSDLKLSIISTGTEAGVWGQITNTNLYLLQQAIGGYQAISIAGGAQTTTLTMSDGAISNARNAVIKLTGTITGNQVVTIPTGIEKTYIVSNGTTGAFTVEFKQAGGTGTTFSTTDKGIKILFADGTNIVDVNSNFSASSFPQINDSNGNEEIIFTTTASAVNELTIANAATGNAPSIATSGSDTNISLTIAPKGTGDVNVDADTLRVGDSNADATITTNGTGDLTISTNSGSNSGTIKIFDGVNGNIELLPNGSGVVKLDGLSYPTADGSANQALVTNGSGVLSFAAVGAAAGQVIQVVSVNKTDTFSSSATGSGTDVTGMSVSITPSSASNKILVMCSVNVAMDGADAMRGLKVVKVISAVTTNSSPVNDNSGSKNNWTVFNQRSPFDTNGVLFSTMQYLDSPATTSAITYKLQFGTGELAQSATMYINRTVSDNYMRGASTITVMEVKG
jgi:hypothetical protein